MSSRFGGPGIVVLDTNALKTLASDAVRDRVVRGLSARGLALWPSALNLLEAIATDNPRVRERLIEIIRALAGPRPLLPLPTTLLKRIGNANVAGDHGLHVGPSGLEWVIEDQSRLTADRVSKAQRTLRERQLRIDEAHRQARRKVRAWLGERELGDPWGQIPRFLDGFWMEPQHLGEWLKWMWQRLQLPATPPLENLLQDETWRLYFEGFGATVYERAIQSQTAQPAHTVDVEQLVYLGGTRHRVLVTEDKGLLRVARAVLEGRHAGSGVLTPPELLELYGN